MRALALTAAAVTGAGMVATPLSRPGGSARRRLASVVVGGLATTTTANAVRRWGPRRAASAAAAITLATTVIEHVGASSGFPFGRYRYTGRLQPTVAGVPVVVPLAWWAMAVPAREVAHGALDRHSTARRRVGLGALALTAWDLLLDPQMTGEDFWRWSRPGGYRSIPLTNYAGWVVTSAGVMAALERLLPPGEADPGLTGQYAAMGVLETLGFAAFFRDRLVAVVGGLGMLPIAAIAIARLRRA